MSLKKTTAQEYLDEITAGLAYRRRFGLEDTWLDIEAKFRGVSLATDTGPNIVQSRGDALISALATPDVAPMITGLSEAAAAVAPVVEAFGTKLLDVLNAESVMEEALTHAYLFGVGLIKIGFDSEYGYDPRYRMGALGGTLTQFNRRGELIESGLARSGLPWIAPVLPHDVVVPWGTRRIEDASTVWHRVVRHIDDVRADEKYNANRNRVKPTVSMRDIVTDYGKVKERAGEETPKDVTADGTDDEAQFVVLWEGMRRATGRIVVVALGGKDEPAVIIRDEPNSLQIGTTLPWLDVRLDLQVRTFWTTPSAFYIVSHQNELDDIHWQAKMQRRATVLKLAILEGALDEKGKANLASARPALFVEIKNDRCDDVRAAIAELGTNPNVNTLLHMEADYILGNARDTLGLSQNMSGEYESKNRRPAAETLAVEAGGALRIGRKQKAFRRSYATLLERLVGICAAHWGAPSAVEYIGPDGARAWGVVSQEVLTKGQFAFSVRFSPTHAQTPETRLQEALALAQLFGQDPRIDQAVLLQNVIAGAGGRVQPAQGANGNANLRVPVSGVSGSNGGAGGEAGGASGAASL